MTIAVTDRETQIDNLLALSHEDFQTLVSNNLGQEAPELLWQLLAHPKLARRTSAALARLYTNICDQMAERTAKIDALHSECFHQGDEGKQTFFAARGEYRSWRSRALVRRRLLNGRIAEIKQALTAPPPQSQPMSRDRKVRLMSTVFRLGWAIREHREQCLDAGIVPEEHDTALWDALAEIEVQTVDGPITVAKMLDDAAAKPGFVSPTERESEPA